MPVDKRGGPSFMRKRESSQDYSHPFIQIPSHSQSTTPRGRSPKSSTTPSTTINTSRLPQLNTSENHYYDPQNPKINPIRTPRERSPLFSFSQSYDEPEMHPKLSFILSREKESKPLKRSSNNNSPTNQSFSRQVSPQSITSSRNHKVKQNPDHPFQKNFDSISTQASHTPQYKRGFPENEPTGQNASQQIDEISEEVETQSNPGSKPFFPSIRKNRKPTLTMNPLETITASYDPRISITAVTRAEQYASKSDLLLAEEFDSIVQAVDSCPPTADQTSKREIEIPIGMANRQTSIINQRRFNTRNSSLIQRRNRKESTIVQDQEEVQYNSVTSSPLGDRIEMQTTMRSLSVIQQNYDSSKERAPSSRINWTLNHLPEEGSGLSPLGRKSQMLNLQMASQEGYVSRSLKRMLISLGKEIDEPTTILSQQSEPSKRVYIYLMSQWQLLMKQILRRDLDCIQEVLVSVLNSLVKFNDVQCFLNVLMLLSKLYLDFSDFNRAVFFLLQGKIICDYTRNFKSKVDFLKLLAYAATQLKMHQHAIGLLGKALQYAWYLKDRDAEILMYDLLGLSYFYSGKMETARIYHNKFLSQLIEEDRSSARESAVSDINYFMKKLEVKSNGFSRNLFLRLSLPIINVFEVSQSRKISLNSTRQSRTSFLDENPVDTNGMNGSITCDAERFITYKNCDAVKQLETLLSNSEFENQVHSPSKSHQILDSTIDQDNEGKKKRKDRQKREEDQASRSIETKSHHFGEYKVSHEQKVKVMIEDKSSYQNTMDKVKHILSLKSSASPSTKLVFLNHFENQNMREIENLTLLPYSLKKKYSRLLGDIIAESVIRKHYSSEEIQHQRIF